MSFLNKMTSKVQDTASATKLLAQLKQGKTISGQVVEAFIKKDLNRVISLVEGILGDESDDRKADSYFTMGTMCQNANKIDLAEDCYNKSIEFKETGKTYEHLSEIYLNDDASKALECLNKALELNNDSENIYKMLIDIYKREKNYERLMDIVWAFIKKYTKKEWAWESKTCLFNQESWNNLLDLKTPGSALVFVLKEAMETETPERVIKLSDDLSAAPFPIFSGAIEEAAYHWIRAICYKKIHHYTCCADEWYKMANLKGLQTDIKLWADAEWRAHELAGHFDPQVLEKIMKREQTARQGQFMKATILFCDIRGFSRFSYEFRHAPQVILQFLQPNFDKSQEIIISNNGILDKYLGDGFIAFFVPESQDEQGYSDSVNKALKTSIELQEYFDTRLPEWAEIWKRNLDETSCYEKLCDQIGLGIGIHTGFVFLGEVGTGKRHQYTVLGNVVNFTARLQGKAPRKHIVLSAPIYEYIKNNDLKYPVQEMPEEDYSDLKNIPGSYKLYYINCEKE